MGLQFVAPSAGVLNTYQESLLDFMGPHVSEVILHHAPVGTLGIGELANDATLDDVAASGCRMIAAWPDGSLTSCEMTNPTLYGLAKFRNFVIGEAAQTLFARIVEAKGLDAVQSADYELHFLSVPGIYFEGLHLVCQGSGSDLILPVSSQNAELPTNAVMAAADFLAAAGPVAAARLSLVASSDLSS